MDPRKTALILIGYQNDYFAGDGRLAGIIEESANVGRVVANTVTLLERLRESAVTVVSTPIYFTDDYGELLDPVGILKTIRDVGAFKQGSFGACAIPELAPFADRIVKIPGKRGLNAFSETELDDYLRDRGVEHVVLAGAVTSVCVDSTGRSAHERGYRVSVLSDCTSARTAFEQGFYCTQIFPLYAQVIDHIQLLELLER